MASKFLMFFTVARPVPEAFDNVQFDLKLNEMQSDFDTSCSSELCLAY